MKYPSLDTALVHAGVPHPRIEGAVSSPIFCSANFEYAGETNYHDLKYIRLNNTPNHVELHSKLAAISGAEAALATASGMAAISATLMTLLKPGDHILVQHGLYGGTHTFLTQDLSKWGVKFSFVDGNAPQDWAESIRPETKAFYCESISNPMVQLSDLAKIVEFCKERKLVSLIDNTFCSPINFRPIERGFDLVIHSATKYLNGHSDIVAGAILGSKERVQSIRHFMDHLGASIDPHACFLLTRGLKTLHLRVERQNANALALAQALEEHPGVTKVHYPGLESHPYHERAKSLFSGFGGVLAFEAQGDPDRIFERLKYPVMAPSLGGVETLVTLPAKTSHAGVSEAERLQLGISNQTIRVAIGVEKTQDLVEDFLQAL